MKILRRYLLLAFVGACAPAERGPPTLTTTNPREPRTASTAEEAESESESAVSTSSASASAAPSTSPAPPAVVAAAPAPPDHQMMFNQWKDLPAAMRAKVPAALFTTKTLIRLEVNVGCQEPDVVTCKTFAWPAYGARCKAGKGAESALVTLPKISGIDLWPNGFKPKKGVPVSFSWHVTSSADGKVSVPVTLGCDAKLHPGGGKRVLVSDVFWFAVPKRKKPIELVPYEGSDLCMCME